MDGEERGRPWCRSASARSADASGLDGDTRAALAVAESDPQALTDAQALTLMTADGAALREVARIADDLRRDVVGDDVTYVLNRNINFTNVCYTGCRFCAFAQRRTDADAYRSPSTRWPTAPSRRGPTARPRCACRAASTRSCPGRRTSTSPPR